MDKQRQASAAFFAPKSAKISEKSAKKPIDFCSAVLVLYTMYKEVRKDLFDLLCRRAGCALKWTIFGEEQEMKSKKLLAIVLCLLMIVSLLPVGVFADGGDEYVDVTINLGGAKGADTYVVAGSANENIGEANVATPIFGTAWDPTLAANQMTESDGVYTKTYSVASAYAVQFKVVKNGETWYGDSYGNNVSLNLPAGCTLTVTFNPSTNSISTSVVMDYTTIYLASDLINDWAPNGKAMTQVRPGVWETKLDVPAGHCYYKFTVDGSWDRSFGKGPYQSTFTTGSAREAKFGGNDNMDLVFDAATTVTLQLDLSNFNYQTQSGAKYTVSLPKTDYTVTSCTYSTNGTTGDYTGGTIKLKSPVDYMNRPQSKPAGTMFTFTVEQYIGYEMTLTAFDEEGAAVPMYLYSGPTVNVNQGKSTYVYALDIPASDVTVHAAFTGQKTYHYMMNPSLIPAGSSSSHIMTDAEKAEVIDVCTVEPEYAHEGDLITVTISPKAGYFIKHSMLSYSDYGGTLTQTGDYTFTFTAQQSNSRVIKLSTTFASGLDQGYYVQVDNAAQTDWIKLVNEYPFYGGTGNVTTVWAQTASFTAGQQLTAWYVSNPGADPVQKASVLTVDDSGAATVYYVNEGQGSLYLSNLNGYYLVHANVTSTRPYGITEAEAFTQQADGSYTYDGCFKGGHWVEVALFENGRVTELCVGSTTSIVGIPRDDDNVTGFPYNTATAGRAAFYPNGDGTNCNVKEGVLRVTHIYNIGYSEEYTNFTVQHLDAIHNNNTAAEGETVNILVTPHAGSNYEIVSVTAAQGTTPVVVAPGEESTYSFVMPAGDVIITVETAPAVTGIPVTNGTAATVEPTVAVEGGEKIAEFEPIAATQSAQTASVKQSDLEAYAQENNITKFVIYTGMGATAGVGQTKASQMQVTDDSGNVVFQAEGLGAQLRYDKKLDGSTVIGDYASTGNKATAIDYVDLRLQYRFTLPEGVNIDDTTWSWELDYAGYHTTTQGVKVNLESGRTYITNVVITNIPLAAHNQTDFQSKMTISYVKDGITYEYVQSDNAPLARAIDDMVTAYKTPAIYNTLGAQIKVYIDALYALINGDN